jgi:deoxyribodipyrimidine photo-lyase
MNLNRVKQIKTVTDASGPVVYWMQRDQRVDDNWALIFAQQKALENKEPLIVIFCLVPEFLGATMRQYDFMLKGLEEVEKKLTKLNIPFKLLTGKPGIEIPLYLSKLKAGTLISDFNPLKIIRQWKKEILNSTEISFYTVDAHNIVPAWVVSDKEEFAAYTIRPKVHRALPEYLDKFTKLKKMKNNNYSEKKNNWNKIRDTLKIDFSVEAIDWLKPGEKAAKAVLKNFFDDKLSRFDSERNDPTKDALSNLSPYLHYGQISAQRIALDGQVFIEQEESLKSFLEELIVRRELADNYCLYNSNYDSFDGFRDWAKTTLNVHRNDKREYLYSINEFEMAGTHDDLWNAAQQQMMKTGKMHGYMRMYWAKKILEWTKSPEEAMEIAIYLNDKYELDGRDPNGYTGIAWSIGGIHDRAWAERPVFGKIRFMNYNGCKRKFNVKQYIESYK